MANVCIKMLKNSENNETEAIGLVTPIHRRVTQIDCRLINYSRQSIKNNNNRPNIQWIICCMLYIINASAIIKKTQRLYCFVADWITQE